jgi:TusE/DsrC/DsvC family sulfur relay protein
MEFEINGTTIETDSEGYLTELGDWSEDLAVALASRDNLALSDDHWEIINFLRRGFQESGTVPNIRLLQKALVAEYGPEKGDKQYLYKLFPYGPAKQAARIAGLPKPTGCV